MQVDFTSKQPTLDTNKGEKAFLIKNNEGDWKIVRGAWAGFKKGKAGKKGVGKCYIYYS